MKKIKSSYVLILICLIVIGVLIAVFVLPKEEKIPKVGNLHYKIVEETKLDMSMIEDLLKIIPPWEEWKITQQYFTLKYNEKEYENNCDTEISQELIGEKLGSASSTGYDERKDIRHSINATIYEIKGLSKDAIVAAQFEGRNDYFAYIDYTYRPETLEQFFSDLNLKENLSFGTIRYDMYLETKYVKFEFKNVPAEEIWNKLLKDNVNAKPADEDLLTEKSLMYIESKVTFSNSENIQFWITEDGYLGCNALKAVHEFFIGKEKVEEFMNYVFDNYEAEATVYHYEEEKENKRQDDTIVMMINEM